MLLNVVNAGLLALMLVFLSATTIKADDTQFDDSAPSMSDYSDFKEASNVLSETNSDSTDDEDGKRGSQYYSLGDDDDDFD